MTQRPRIVLLVGKDRADVAALTPRLCDAIAASADFAGVVILDGQDLSTSTFDIAVVLGGDGSMLRAARLMGEHQRPTLGVNFGRLGFLADLSVKEFLTQLPAIAAGQFPIVEHLMFRCQLIRGGVTVLDQLGLNEVTVHAGPPFSILEIDLYVDGELVTTYSCDGLIVSTPVGSTAHNVSAGGPILRQDLQAFVISPISPHTLTNRPVVDAAERVYELVAHRPHAGTTLVADGRVLDRLIPGDRVRILRAEPRFKLIKLPGHNYYRTLREKLGWGGNLVIERGG